MDEEAKDKSAVGPLDNFYIFEGRQLSDFINQTVLKNLSPLCQLENFKTSVYRLPGGKSVVCLSEGNDIDRTAQITELLAPWLNAASQVTAFSFQAAYSYNTTKDFDKRCFVRSVCGSQSDASFPDLPFVEPMEDCNMIYGVCAGGKPLYNSDFSAQNTSNNRSPLSRQFPLGVTEANCRSAATPFISIAQQLTQSSRSRFCSYLGNVI